MKYQGKITDPKDLVTKEYVDTGLSGKQNTLTFDDVPTAGSSNPVKSSGIKSALIHDLANISATGSTNTTGATIASGTYFYLNGALVRAKADIAVNATFTNGTNYEAVTAGGLNDILRIEKTSLDISTGVSIQGSLTNIITKQLSIVSISINFLTSSSQSGTFVVGTIPSGFWPIEQTVKMPVHLMNANGTFRDGFALAKNEDGSIEVQTSATDVRWIRLSYCYSVAT